MRQTVTLSKKDIRRIVALKDRIVALADELEGNGAVPVRRRRRKKVEPAPAKPGSRLFEGIQEPKRKRAAPAATTSAP